MPAPEARTALDRFTRDPRTGRVVLAQQPNPSLVACGVLSMGAAVFPSHAPALRRAGTGALVAWAADELMRGLTPARRVLGLAVLAGTVRRLIRG